MEPTKEQLEWLKNNAPPRDSRPMTLEIVVLDPEEAHWIYEAHMDPKGRHGVRVDTLCNGKDFTPALRALDACVQLLSEHEDDLRNEPALRETINAACRVLGYEEDEDDDQQND